MERSQLARRLRVPLVAMALMLVGTSLGGCQAPSEELPSLHDVLMREPWVAGVVEIEDTIEAIERFNTSQGPAVMLLMEPTGPIVDQPWGEQDDCFGILADPRGEYRVGDRHRTALHFRNVTFNGAPGLLAAEMACPAPLLPVRIGDVLDQVAWHLRGGLFPRETDANGWTNYEYLHSNQVAVSLENVSATLVQWPGTDSRLDSYSAWVREMANFWVNSMNVSTNCPSCRSGPGGELVDELTTLEAPYSGDDRLRFVDANANGLLDDHDRLLVRLETPANSVETFFVHLDCYACPSPQVIVSGPDGPITWDLHSATPGIQLRLKSPTPDDEGADTILVGAVPDPARLAVVFSVRFADGGGSWTSASVADLPGPVGSAQVDYVDVNRDGLLNVGDAFQLTGVPPKASAVFSVGLYDNQHAGGTIVWYSGYGQVVIDGIEWGYETSDAIASRAVIVPPYNYDRISNHPELDFGKTLTATVRGGDAVLLDHAPLGHGVVGTWPTGELRFLDKDESRGLSVGDVLQVDGAAGVEYEVEIGALFDAVVLPVTLKT